MFVFDWTRQAVESRGWRYEVWSEPPHAELENVRFLAGYRRDWFFDNGQHTFQEGSREKQRSGPR
ncbi:hypothetical protein ACOBQX_16515 [Actinokineospora sp. G85]|uniref:hypothetical protein n=1 Tax=Actinokineospora sp. G85 TaxID=3406626 RepID=UPI003C7563F5